MNPNSWNDRLLVTLKSPGAVAVCLALLATTTTVLWAAPATTPHYKIIDLGICPEPDSSASDFDVPKICINNRGQVAGVEAWHNGHGGLWRWSNGRKLFFAPSFAQYTVSGINDLGQIVGNASVSVEKRGEPSRENGGPWMYDKDHMKRLDFAGTESEVLGINARGDMVGWKSDAGHRQAFVRIGKATSFLFADALTSEANAINARGQVVGTQILDTTVHPNAALWSSGKTTQVDDSPSRDSSVALAINAQGQFVGWRSSPRTANPRAFSQLNGIKTDLSTLPGGVSSRAIALSETGTIVGESSVSSAQNGITHAFVWKGTMTDLNGWLPPRSGWTLTSATGINTRGQIVGFGIFQTKRHAFLLTPTT